MFEKVAMEEQVGEIVGKVIQRVVESCHAAGRFTKSKFNERGG